MRSRWQTTTPKDESQKCSKKGNPLGHGCNRGHAPRVPYNRNKCRLRRIAETNRLPRWIRFHSKASNDVVSRTRKDSYWQATVTPVFAR
jgi:hypothetical protein